MAKKKHFGQETETGAQSDGKMARVIISTKLGNNKYAYKESIVSRDQVKDYIDKKKS